MKKIMLLALIAVLSLSSCELDNRVANANETSYIVKNVSVINGSEYKIETREGITLSAREDNISYEVKPGDFIAFDKNKNKISKLTEYNFSDTFWFILIICQINYWLGCWLGNKNRD